MCLAIIGLLIIVVAVIIIVGVIGGTVTAVAENKQENEELASMMLEDLEDRLKMVRQQIAYAKLAKVTPAEQMNLIGKEGKIVGVIRKRWEESLNDLTLEQLEEHFSELPSTPKLGANEVSKRQKVLTRVIKNRRDALIKSEAN